MQQKALVHRFDRGLTAKHMAQRELLSNALEQNVGLGGRNEPGQDGAWMHITRGRLEHAHKGRLCEQYVDADGDPLGRNWLATRGDTFEKLDDDGRGRLHAQWRKRDAEIITRLHIDMGKLEVLWLVSPKFIARALEVDTRVVHPDLMRPLAVRMETRTKMICQMLVG